MRAPAALLLTGPAVLADTGAAGGIGIPPSTAAAIMRTLDVMKFTQTKSLLGVTCWLCLMVPARCCLAQQATRPAAPVPATPTEEVKSLPRDIGKIHGLAWDGVHGGLWLVTTDEAGSAHGVLIDPATATEIRRIPLPSSSVMGHDGVGLWCKVAGASGTAYRRVRTAPGLSAEQAEQGLHLPPDLPQKIDIDTFHTVVTSRHIGVYNIVIFGPINGRSSWAVSMQNGPHLVRYDNGLARKPDTDARYKKALAYERANGTLKALPLFEQIFTDDPSAVEIRNHVAWALATRPQEPYHNLNRAMELLQVALTSQPWNPEMWDTMAEIYWRRGDAAAAAHLEAKAINLNPQKSFYWRQYEKFQKGPTSQEAPEPSY